MNEPTNDELAAAMAERGLRLDAGPSNDEVQAAIKERGLELEEIDKMKHSHEIPLQGGVSNDDKNMDLGDKAAEVIRGMPAGAAELADVAKTINHLNPVTRVGEEIGKFAGNQIRHATGRGDAPPEKSYYEDTRQALPPKDEGLYGFGGDIAKTAMTMPVAGPEFAGAKSMGAAAKLASMVSRSSPRMLERVAAVAAKKRAEEVALKSLGGAVTGGIQGGLSEGIKQHTQGKVDLPGLARETAIGAGMGGAWSGAGARFGTRNYNQNILQRREALARQAAHMKELDDQVQQQMTQRAWQREAQNTIPEQRDAELLRHGIQPRPVPQPLPLDQFGTYKRGNQNVPRQNPRESSPGFQSQVQQQKGISETGKQAATNAATEHGRSASSQTQGLLKTVSDNSHKFPAPHFHEGTAPEIVDMNQRAEMEYIKRARKAQGGREVAPAKELSPEEKAMQYWDQSAFEQVPADKKKWYDVVANAYKPSGISSAAVIPGSHQILGAIAKVSKKANLEKMAPEVAQRLLGNQTTSDIIEHYADPAFTHAYHENIFGKLSQATKIKGFKVPSSPEAVEEFGRSRYMTAQEIHNLPNLTDEQKLAAININSVLEDQAQLHKNYIAQLPNGRLKTALQKDLSANLDRSAKEFQQGAHQWLNAITHSAVNRAVLGNPTIHFIHLAEAGTQGFANAPIAFSRATVRLANPKDKLIHEFVNSFAGTGSFKQMQISSPNPISRKSAQAQNWLWNKVPGSQNAKVQSIGNAVRDVVSGTTTENAKMKSLYATAGLQAAQEMGYTADGFMQSFNSNSMPADQMLRATVLINQKVNRWIGSTPLGYRDMTAVDRLAESKLAGPLGQAMVRFAVPFTRSGIMQSRAFAKTGADALKHLSQKNYVAASRSVGAGLMMYGTVALFAGAKAIPPEISAELTPEQRMKLDEHMEKLALVGNALDSRIEHLQPTMFPLARVAPSAGFAQSTMKDVQNLADQNHPEWSWKKTSSAVSLVSLAGLDSIADTMSPTQMAKIARRMAEVDEKGGWEQWVYKEWNLPRDIQAAHNTLTKGKADSGFIAHGIVPKSRAQAFIDAALKPGIARENYKYKMEREHETDAEEAFKERYGEDIHKEALRDYFRSRPVHSELYKEHKKPSFDPSTPGGKRIMSWAEGAAYKEDTQGQGATFWRDLLKQSDENPKFRSFLESLKAPKQPPVAPPVQISKQIES